MPFREGPNSEIVANNRSRGWQNLSVKSKEQQEFMAVTPDTYKEMCGKLGAEANAEDFEGFVDEQDDFESFVALKPAPASSVMIAPWENSELDYLLAFQLYKCAPPCQTRVVGLEAGGGSLAMMRLRQKVVCTLLVNSEAQKRAILQSCLLNITVEILTNKTDGFEMKRKRVLTREGSLTGEYAPSTSSAAQTPPPPLTQETDDGPANDQQGQSRQEPAGDGQEEPAGDGQGQPRILPRRNRS